MADIAAADLVYTIADSGGVTIQNKLRRVKVTIAFGDAVDDYPTGGIPLTRAKMGLPNVIDSLHFSEDDAGQGFVYKFDESAETIRIYQGDNDEASDGPLIEFINATDVPAATTLEVVAWGS